MSITKADLELRIAELETQLANSHGDPRKAGLTCITGLIKGVKTISRPGMKLSVAGFLTNNSQESAPDGSKFKVDLPVDGFIATDNGQPIASQILEIASQYDWAVVAIYGRWVPLGEIKLNQRGYHYAERRQLRAQFIDILHCSAPVEQQEPEAVPFSHEPDSELPDF